MLALLLLLLLSLLLLFFEMLVCDDIDHGGPLAARASTASTVLSLFNLQPRFKFQGSSAKWSTSDLSTILYTRCGERLFTYLYASEM